MRDEIMAATVGEIGDRRRTSPPGRMTMAYLLWRAGHIKAIDCLEWMMNLPHADADQQALAAGVWAAITDDSQ